MTREYNSVIGSGTTPNIAHAPPFTIPQGTFPVASQRDSLRNRQGEGVVCLNPEDYSISINLRSQSIIVAATGIPLPANPLEYRRALVIHNNGSSTIYLGDSSVTSLNGFPLLAGEKISFDIKGTPKSTIYAITSGASVDVRILELS